MRCAHDWRCGSAYAGWLIVPRVKRVSSRVIALCFPSAFIDSEPIPLCHPGCAIAPCLPSERDSRMAEGLLAHFPVSRISARVNILTWLNRLSAHKRERFCLV